MIAEEGAGFRGGFTVLMPVYRGDTPAGFERAVRSVFGNTLRPDACVLAVDGPTDDALAQTIAGLEREFLMDVVRLPDHLGLAGALNAGLTRVETDWVMRADADDVNLPPRFARLAAAVAGADAPDLVGSAIVEVDREGRHLGVRRTPLTHAEIVRHVRYRNPFNHMSVVFRRELAVRCGGYPPIIGREDYGLWALMIQAGAVTRNLADVLVRATAGREMYRRRGGLSYALGEIALQRHLVVCGLTTPYTAAVQGLLRGSIFVLPAQLRERVYERLLRGDFGLSPE